MNGWRVLGVDACKSGWVGVALSEGAVSAYAAAEIGGLVEEAAAGGPLVVIAVDIPIGLGGISRQAFALQAKVLQVDRWVRTTLHRVVEVHPEASFAELAGTALQSRKSSWAGTVLRRRLLAGAGISLPDDLGPAGEKAAVDDCWTPPQRPGPPCASFGARRGPRPARPSCSATNCPARSGRNDYFR